MRAAEIRQRRIFGMAAVDRKRAARREGAALRQPRQRRDRARNFRKAIVALALQVGTAGIEAIRPRV